jgi:hypothetical protein
VNYTLNANSFFTVDNSGCVVRSLLIFHASPTGYVVL